MGDLIYSDEAKQTIKEQADKLSPIKVKEQYGAGFLHPGVATVIKDETFIANKIDWPEEKALHGEGVIQPNQLILSIYGEPIDTDIDSIYVEINGVQIPKTMYYIEPLALGLHFRDLTVTKESTVKLSSKYDYKQKDSRSRVLILPTSKAIPFAELDSYAPVLFEPITINHLLKYPDNKRHEKSLAMCKEDVVYVLEYNFERRGIYATVKYYTE